MLLRLCLTGRRRYSEFQEELPISHAVLSARLDQFVGAGLLTRREYSTRPPRSEYVLTQKGRATWPILAMIWGWERAWVEDHRYPTPPIRHETCGREVTLLLTCSHCGGELRRADLDARWGRAGGWAESVPPTRTRRRSSSRETGEISFYPDTVAIFGNGWSSAIVGAAFLGVRRFTDFQRFLGVPPGSLSDRLRILVSHGVLDHAVTDHLSSSPSSTSKDESREYTLTDKGEGFLPVVLTTVSWAERWVGEGDEEVLQLTHLPCGASLRPTVTCGFCRASVRGRDITIGQP